MSFLTLPHIGLLLLAYLLGAIPTSLWTGKLIHGLDIRQHGSQNAGATNTIRVLGLSTGIPVLLFDIFKGWVATQLAFLFSLQEDLIAIKLLLGLLAVTGHLFPIFARFKGGKGIATLFGMFLGIHALSALIALGIFILIFGLTRIVSLGSIIAVISYPLISSLLFGLTNQVFLAVTLFFVILVLYTHRENIKRLLKGKEKQLSLGKNTNSQE